MVTRAYSGGDLCQNLAADNLWAAHLPEALAAGFCDCILSQGSSGVRNTLLA